MFKELTTMALVATISTSVSNNFNSVLAAAKDIVSIHTAAAENIGKPNEFFNSVAAQQKRLGSFGEKVAAMDVEKLAALNLQKQAGPFGVMMPTK